MNLAAAVRFGDRDPGQVSREQAGQPPFPHWRSGVAGDEAPVTESGGVTQVGIVISADELHQRLGDSRAVAPAVAGWHSQAEIPAHGKLAADP